MGNRGILNGRSQSKMSSVVRQTAWRLRSVRMKIQNIPLLTCKSCYRLLTEIYHSEWVCVYLLAGTFATLLCMFLGYLVIRDPCFQWEIKTKLCDDYQSGLAAGALCYSLCAEKTISLSRCVETNTDISVFRWNELFLKAPRPKVKRKGQVRSHMPEVEDALWEGMTVADFVHILEHFFSKILGNSDHSTLIEKTIQYSDFNKDGKIQFGEIRSLWQLLQVREFQTLLLFQGNNDVFPTLNGTCGNLYAMETLYHDHLYDRKKSWILDKIFPYRHQWGFPEFDKRVHLALGLLEYAYSTMETENSRFYMCNFNPRNFGFTQYFEMKVSNLDGIVSRNVLNRHFQDISCESDAACKYGDVCRSTCNKTSHRCNKVSSKYIPDLVKVCRMLKEYVLYDIPDHLKEPVRLLVYSCLRLEKKSQTLDHNVVMVDEMLTMDLLNKVFWDEIKYKQLKFLQRPTKRPGAKG